jgi:hypothetical protein
MAYEIPILNVTLVTSGDLSTKQYTAVKLTTGSLILGASTGEDIIGVLQDAPASGKSGIVMTHGITLAYFGGNVLANADLQVDASGKFITYSSGTKVAKAMEAGAANELRTIMLRCN